jgi:mono/diheme cytochrome c family protein
MEERMVSHCGRLTIPSAGRQTRMGNQVYGGKYIVVYTVEMKKFLLATALVISLGIGLFAQARGADPKTMKNPTAATPQSIQAGGAIYQKSCAVCHGPMGKGDGAIVASLKPEATKPPNLTDAEWKHGSTDGELFTVIHDGIGPKFEMKGQTGKLSDQDIWNVVNYVKSLSSKK